MARQASHGRLRHRVTFISAHPRSCTTAGSSRGAHGTLLGRHSCNPRWRHRQSRYWNRRLWRWMPPEPALGRCATGRQTDSGGALLRAASVTCLAVCIGLGLRPALSRDSHVQPWMAARTGCFRVPARMLLDIKMQTRAAALAATARTSQRPQGSGVLARSRPGTRFPRDRVLPMLARAPADKSITWPHAEHDSLA